MGRLSVMELNPLLIEGAFEILPEPNSDARGHFVRTYDEAWFREHGMHRDWVQESQSMTREKDVVRGLHFQCPPHAETKIMRLTQGRALDVLVDLRSDSATFHQWCAVELSAKAMNMVFAPPGCAHGFCTLTEDVVMQYKIDVPHALGHEGGLRWNDSKIGIQWPADQPQLSERDAALPGWSEFENPF